MKVFSFCIYGEVMKYYFGLEENCRIINEFYPEYHVYIYYGLTHLSDFLKHLSETYKNIHMFETNQNGPSNMMYRYKPVCLDDIECVISRDSDSEINSRDRHCINDFINSPHDTSVQIIRDHFWHKSKIMGGISIFINKNNIFIKLKEELLKIYNDIEQEIIKYNYGTDESILSNRIYPMIKDSFLVYSNISVFKGEKYKFIDYSNDGTNFCGNVVEYSQQNSTISKKHQFNYFDYDIISQLNFLNDQTQYEVILRVINEFNSYYSNAKLNDHILYFKIISLIHLSRLEECMETYKEFYKFTITSQIKSTIPLFFEKARENGYITVGTCDLNYVPNNNDTNNEIVIYFGNFPDDYLALPQSRQIYRHFIFKDNIIIDRYEYHECWQKIDRIFIMGLEKEDERMNDTIMHLVSMNAPLHRIEEYRAKKDATLTDTYVGVTKNHMDCLKIMIDSSYNTCLFLEDDFVFTSTIRENQQHLSNFLNRNYDYNICFLSASKYHKRLDFDDLLIISKQICTTSSGYLINKNNVQLVYDTVKEGYEKMIETPDSTLYCIDRYWVSLEKLFIFKNKIGFQKPSLSKITGKLNIELD